MVRVRVRVRLRVCMMCMNVCMRVFVTAAMVRQVVVVVVNMPNIILEFY